MVGNWITRIITQAEKIKTAIKKRASKEEIKNSKWMSPLWLPSIINLLFLTNSFNLPDLIS